MHFFLNIDLYKYHKTHVCDGFDNVLIAELKPLQYEKPNVNVIE